ncbi:MAG TPA: hypothetical protein VJS85_03700 [Rhizomicrobium sp.]|nr:hypothetical protein [Rhizomicrobium sp.]
MVKAAKTAGWGRGNKIKNQGVIGVSRSGAPGVGPSRRLGTKGKAGSTRDIGAAFHPEGGIIFSTPKRKIFHVASPGTGHIGGAIVAAAMGFIVPKARRKAVFCRFCAGFTFARNWLWSRPPWNHSTNSRASPPPST